MILDNAVVYDTEAFPNAWILCAESLHDDRRVTFEISDWRNDHAALCQWIDALGSASVPMISYNGIGYDYPMLHHIRMKPGITAADIYEKNQSIIGSSDRFGHTIWERDRFVPQIDLMKVHHYDNPAKATALKALQINMRAKTVRESVIPFGTILTEQQLRDDVIPYCWHDVQETKRFAHYSMGALRFRQSLITDHGADVMNWNDTKIGEEMLIKRLGNDVCFDYSSGRKTKRQTIRHSIPVSDLIFPYISFDHPEFNRILTFMRGVTLGEDDMRKTDNPDHVSPLTIQANVGGLSVRFGSGGVHASVDRQRFIADDNWCIRDVDVAGMYPAISNVNRLAPKHLGEPFIAVYKTLPEERAQHKKGTPENLAFKLGGNAAWGKSKSVFSCFYDPAYALSVPINGQLMICMLVDKLLTVPTLQMIQMNTDGCTYYVRREYLDQCKAIEKWWESYTCLTLEDVMYRAMYVRDVNGYIAESVDSKRKLKGPYWYPRDFQEALDGQAAHKDYNPTVVQRAAVAAMLDGIDPVTFIRTHTDPFDFMCRIRVDRASRLMLGDETIQSTTRYYVTTDGKPMQKISPPPKGFAVGQYKKAPRITNAEYHRVMAETGGKWDERICTKSQSVYENRTTNIQSGWLVQECNDIASFRFDNVNYDWYVNEARKLII